MKILAIADVEEKILWDFFDKELVRDVELIISCGDLSVHYLDFLVSMTNCPLLLSQVTSAGLAAESFFSPSIVMFTPPSRRCSASSLPM